MASQNPIPGQQSAGDNEPGVTIETVGEAAPVQTVPQPEETPGDSGTPSEQPPTEGGDASGGQPDAAAAAAEQKKEKSDVQKRIDTLTRRRYELEGRNEELEIELARMKRRLTALEGGEQEPKPAAPVVDPNKPNRENFTTYEDWVEAVSLYNAKKALQDEKDEFYRQQQTTQQNTIVENWNKSIEAAREKYEDFDTVVGSSMEIPQAAFNAIVDSPVGTDIAYFLGSHPEIAAGLGKLTPVACVRAIGRIEAQFEIKAPATPAPAPAPAATPAGAPGASQSKGQQPARPAVVQRPKPITSAASAPVEPVGSRPVRSSVNPDEMSYQEYKRWREAGNGR